MAEVPVKAKKQLAESSDNLDDEVEENVNFEIDYQGQDTTDALPRNLTYTKFDTLLIIISILLYIADISSDIFVSYIHLINGNKWWFAFTVIFIGLPSLTMTAFSLRWYLLDVEMNSFPPVSQAKWILRIIFLLLQLGPILRYIDTIIYGCHYNQATQDSREKKEMFLRFYVYEEADATLLRLLECFMESAPQLVLQLYILTQVHPETMVIFGTLVPPSVQTGLLVLSIFLSLCSMSWCLAFYQRALRHTQDDKCNLNLPGLIMQFVWRFLTIGSRVLALALFASTFRYYVLLVCLIRYLLMTTWILSMKTSFYDNKCEEFFYNCVLGVMYIFCYFNPKDTPTRRRYTIFYLLTFVENTLLISLWFRETADCPPWYRLPAVLAQPLLFLLGLLFMIVYYMFFHPTGNIKLMSHWSRSSIYCDHEGPPCNGNNGGKPKLETTSL